MNKHFDIELLPEEFDEEELDLIAELGFDQASVYAQGGLREYFGFDL